MYEVTHAIGMKRRSRKRRASFLEADLNEAAGRRTLRVRRTEQWLPVG
jgi:hypothetical protein